MMKFPFNLLIKWQIQNLKSEIDRAQPAPLGNIIETVLVSLFVQLESLLPPLPRAEELP
jgi:hypothetical protein